MNQGHKYHLKQEGFTLIELMLSMAFISIMLVAIAMLVMQVAAMYNHGATVRTINQASREIITDFQRTLGQANAASVATDAVESNGRLCTGSYSYIWNFPDDGGATPDYPNNIYSGGDKTPIRLVRIVDNGGSYCQKSMVGDEYGASKPIDGSSAYPVELLASGDLSEGLRVRSLKITESTPELLSGEKLFQVTIRLGTDSTDAIDSVSQSCKPPADENNDTQYCAVNELRFTVRAETR